MFFNFDYTRVIMNDSLIYWKNQQKIAKNYQFLTNCIAFENIGSDW
jgi:hypothetical protein